MIKRIKNKIEELYYEYKNSGSYRGFQVIRRKYKTIPLIIAISLIVLGILFFWLPVLNPITATIPAIKLLNRFG